MSRLALQCFFKNVITYTGTSYLSSDQIREAELYYTQLEAILQERSTWNLKNRDMRNTDITSDPLSMIQLYPDELSVSKA